MKMQNFRHKESREIFVMMYGRFLKKKLLQMCGNMDWGWLMNLMTVIMLLQEGRINGHQVEHLKF